MERRMLSLAAAALLAAAPATLASTQAEMEQLIAFLQGRIETEDPTLSASLRYRALLESLEMMGVAVPPGLRSAAPKEPAALARTLLQPDQPGTPAPARPAGMTVVEAANPFDAVPPAGTAEDTAAIPDDVEPGLSEVGPDPVVRAESTAPAGAPAAPPTGPVVRGPPVPQPVASPRAFSMPAIARMARELLDNPGSNPWKPAPKPVGVDRGAPLGPAPAGVARRVGRPAPPSLGRAEAPVAASPAGLPGIRARLRQILASPEPQTDQPAPRSPAPAGRELLPEEVLQVQAQAVLESLQEPPPVPAPAVELAGARQGDSPRVAVVPGGQVRVTDPLGSATVLGEGRHPVAWNSTVAVEAGDRVMVVYPAQGTIFRLYRGAEGHLEPRGIRRISGTVERFLGREDDGLQVFDQDSGSVPAPELRVGHQELPRLELPAGTRASVLYDGLVRTLGPGHHVIDWNSLVQLVEGDSARLVYPVTERVYNFARSAEGYVETSGVRLRSGQIQPENL